MSRDLLSKKFWSRLVLNVQSSMPKKQSDNSSVSLCQAVAWRGVGGGVQGVICTPPSQDRCRCFALDRNRYSLIRLIKKSVMTVYCLVHPQAQILATPRSRRDLFSKHFQSQLV
jgi:hypothetical protein